MPSVALPADQLLGVVERVDRCRPVRVPDRRVHEVEDEDREDLGPPVERAAVAEPPARPAARRCCGAVAACCVVSLTVARRPPAVAFCSRLPDGERRGAEHAHDAACTRNQSRPTAIAWPLLTPERVQEQHERAFAHAEAAERDREHLQHRDRGDVTRASRRSGTGEVERAEDERDGEHDRDLVHDRGAEHAGSAGAGSRRSRSMPTCTAPMNRIQFSCSAKRPAMRGWPARNRIDARAAASVMPAISNAIHAWSTSSSDGRARSR